VTQLSSPVDGFQIAYDVHGAGPDVVLLHGWPGDRHDFDQVVSELADEARLVVPDLRGFGESDRHHVPPAVGYSADAQARSVLALLDDLGIERAVFGGYDIGSRLLQTIARQHPARVEAMVLTPPLPGAGARLLEPQAQSEFWYQNLHRLSLADDLLDGNEKAVRAYLTHLWGHWSGAAFSIPEEHLDRLVADYARPSAFISSIAWYRSRAGSVASARTESVPTAEDRLQAPTRVLWPAQDPLFPAAWSDRLSDFFAHHTLTVLPHSGHFVPLEAPREFTLALRESLAS
jgi:pimeloyl-ACP methyl ester carboxylesterase